MKTTIWLLVSIVAVSVTSTMGQTPYCTSFGTIQPDDVPKLPDQYQLRIEIKSVVEKSIRETHFFYDAPNKRAMMRYVQNNMVTRLIYNYALNEIYKIDENVEPPFDVYDPPDGRPLYPSVCQTYKLSESPMLNFFGFSMLQPESAVPGAPEQVIRFFPQKKGDKVAVGPMVCNQFLSCQYDPFYNANFTAEHFFSDGSYSFAGQTDTYKYIPFRAIFKGVYQIQGSSRNMEIIHDYHDFDTSIPDRVFEIPTTVFCVDKKPTLNVPSVSESFYFSQEITASSFEKTISLTLRDVYAFGKLLTYKYRNHVSQPTTLNSTEPHQYIVDRSLGVQYAINMNSNACRIRGTSRFVPTNSDPYNPALDFISHLEEWHGFLPSKTEFTYHGERKFEGIMSNRFTGQVDSTITGQPNDPIITYSSIFEYAFSQPSITFYNLDQEEKNVPVALLINSDRGEMYSTRSTFYNFESSPSAYRRFDVSPCYDPEDVIHFDLVFPYKEQFTTEELNQVPYLERTIYNLLYVMTAQPVVRYAYPKVTISTDGNLYARSAIFPLPPAETMFTFEGNFLLLVGTLNSSFRINTTEDCMRFCLTNRKCLSVDYNPASNTCYLNPNTTASGAQQTTSLAYQHWRRNGDGLDLAEGFEVYYMLNSLVEDGSVALNFLDGKVGIGKLSDSKEGPDTVPRAKVLFAEKINIVTTTNNRFGTTALLSRFNLKRSRTRLQTQKTVLSKVGVSVDDCARMCVDKVGSECLTFGYCYLSADCIISTYALNDYQENELIADDHCDVYEKDPLLHYERLFIRTTIDKKDKKFSPVSTASECASKCDNEKSIHCRSFNYCGRENLCYLSEAHLLDATAGSNAVDNLTCEHYSRNYITDFTYVNTGEVKLDAEIVLRDADLNSCSTTCVSSKSFNCKTFDYCPESKTCLLNSGEKQVLSNVQAAKEQCAHYRREYYYTTSQSYNFRSSGGSDTVLIVLSILFSILSVAGGVAGTLFVFKKYNLK